ncbi:glycogen synthase GlgA [Thiomicrorhabdus sediminis]|uniref:Glycogen synthase n=1 Tax=Thiomicrorhabdus sediminis TaxID=2580412 RepID=A0A4P9K3T9_9GAMM|nr:glycogen synthase GlgA [Thiomicrorhabdus sediminis]QCU89538.1 glycogen synthase GlgA [Thiomicrorhabdus sediminis]
MKVLFATSEAHPLIKTGGLADVSGSLPNALAELGHQVRLVLPAYRDVMQKLQRSDYRQVAKGSIDGCGKTFEFRVLQIKAGAVKDIDIPVWLVDIEELFDRPGNPYLAHDGKDWWDNGERFALFSMVVSQLAMDELGLKWRADIVHLNDWQTGLTAALLSLYEQRPKTIFTVHNMAYPGNYPKSLFAQLQLPWELWNIEGVEFYGHFSMLKAGLVYADIVTTVSPTYAREICYPQFAYGMEGILQKRSFEGALFGVLNGIDDDVWHPKNDEFIAKNYSVERGRIKAKQINKEALIHDLCELRGDSQAKVDSHLNKWLEKPLVGFVGRLVEQKGIDLVMQTVPEILQQSDANFVFVGTGEKWFEDQVRFLSEQYPSRVWAHIGYSEALAHKVEAGADMFLMPSRFEPCGLNQMYSLAYGTPPIVHHTGGLADTVVNATDENLKNKVANGFVFYDLSRHSLQSIMLHALHLFTKKRTWQAIQKAGMSPPRNWRISAKAYEQLYLKK